MAKSIFFIIFSATALALASPTPVQAQDRGQTKLNPEALAERDVAAQSSGDVAAALSLYSDDAVVQYGGLCGTPCVGKAAVQKELERRVAALNRAKIVDKYVSGNVAVIKTEVRLGSVDASGAVHGLEWSPGVERIVVWNIYEAKGDKIAVVTLVGQRTDTQTARFIEWFRAQASDR